MERARRIALALALGLGLPVLPSLALAQAAAEEEVDEAEGDEETPRLRAPVMEPLAMPESAAEEGDAAEGDQESSEELTEAEGEEEDEEEAESGEELPSPADAEQRLGGDSDPTAEPWTTPQTVFEVHGYMRMRGEFQDQFSLGRNPGMSSDYPFELFIPRDDAAITDSIAGGCSGGSGGSMPGPGCNQRALAYANMRLRVEPTIHLSDDVRVRMQLDVFDNLVLGSTPDGYAVSPYANGAVPAMGESAAYREYSSFVPFTALSLTQTPSSSGLNSWTDSIMVRRAWAEVRNRGLGELRFGRMGNHWGLGILANGGTGIDSDYQSDVDRIMAITRLVGFYFFGAWDFASEGFIYQNPVDQRVPFDWARNDDVDQMTFGVARRATPEEQATALQRGDVVLNGGAFFVYRSQNLTSEGIQNPLNTGSPAIFARRGFEVFVPDLWVQFLYENLRLEAEATMQIGTIDNVALANTQPGDFNGPTHHILNFGVAFEGEYHLLNNQLGIYFNAGFASGDADTEGLTRSQNAPALQLNNDTNVTAFSFHPNYRIDLIFWRTIMRQVSSAYYFRPGLSYDFIRSSFGQLLGARADVVWSRAAEPVQTWGNQADIGLELDAQVYYRSEDGPDILDGFYASLQYGIFFPFNALGYIENTDRPHGQNAQTLRLILGVQY